MDISENILGEYILKQLGFSIQDFPNDSEHSKNPNMLHIGDIWKP